MLPDGLGCTAERVFRVDSGQEHLHYITDICTDALYILDPCVGGGVGVDSAGPNGGGGGMQDEAGLEEMINLANSQMDELPVATATKSSSPPVAAEEGAAAAHHKGASLLMPSRVKRFALYLDDDDD